jgi:hypothetical protein
MGHVTEQIRPIRLRNLTIRCASCSYSAERVMLTPPAANPWKAERPFPNTTTEGDGSRCFESLKHYEQYKRDNHIQEIAHDAPVYRPHGNKVVMTDGDRQPEPGKQRDRARSA